MTTKKQIEIMQTEQPAEYQELIAAATDFNNRRDRISHPDGTFDSAGRWSPSYSEECDCCKNIRQPSRSYPFSLMIHCRTAEHVANLHGVDARLLKYVAKNL
ncbi:hypothetical protein [Trichlorobacter lovleyi]|uniref:hypothetical protein n=1 Tax=Trichlorobacter lovleyi TaxID=313985 RepID=UPI002FDE36DD